MSSQPALTVDPAGLSEAEARRRLAERGDAEPPTSRSWASILRANIFTPLNAVLLAAGAITLVLGDPQDAIFLAILVANAGIGISQEARAKRSLERLAALVAPTATTVRDGTPRALPVEAVVQGDLVLLSAGDQVVADGTLVRSDGLTMDESILTGESESVDRAVGEEVRSGSFCVGGSGAFVAESVGTDTYASRLVGDAREFRHPRSPLERALDRLIVILSVAMVPLGALLAWSLLEQAVSTSEAVSTSVAGVVTIVPEGLVLLIGITYAAASLRIARRGALTQQLNAIESLASADVVCLDKTGTLTEEALRVVATPPADGVAPQRLEDGLARFAASSPSRNTTLQAIADGVPEAVPEAAAASVVFDSRRRWSGLRLGDQTYVLGAPEHFALHGLAESVRAESAAGRRVLAFAAADVPLHDPGADGPPPAGLVVLGLVVLAEQLRPETRETVGFLLEQGVELRVISGDAPATVGAIAADAGIPTGGGALDGADLPEDPGELERVLDSAPVVGRISPEGKRRYVEALAARGGYVAMIGDGVNDVPALKASRIAIAQGSGAQMARSVADVVLVRGGFGSMPPMIAEGRKLLRNLQRVAKLFVAKSVLAAFLILTVGLSSESYPFEPRHLTLASAVTIGIPTFLLALAPSAGPWRPDNFLRELARFAVPAGTAAGFGIVASYLMSLNLLGMSDVEARTVATTVLVGVGLYLIVVLESTTRVRSYAISALCAALLALYFLSLSLPATRVFFNVAVPGPEIVFASLAGVSFAVIGLLLTDERFVPYRRPSEVQPGQAGS